MPKTHPTSVLRTLRKPKNAVVRPREYLTPDEIVVLMKTARERGRGVNGFRDATMILVASRHALRVSELCALRWSQIDFNEGIINVVRLKGSKDGAHPLRGSVLRSLRRLQRESKPSPYVFVNERGLPVSVNGFQKTLRRIGEATEIPFTVHPHMLRHATGFELANKGADTRLIAEYMGHRNINHTTRYTELASGRFEGLYND